MTVEDVYSFPHMRGKFTRGVSVLVSPTYGGSLPFWSSFLLCNPHFPPPMGEVECKVECKNVPHVLGTFAILKAIVFLNLFHHPVLYWFERGMGHRIYKGIDNQYLSFYIMCSKKEL